MHQGSDLDRTYRIELVNGETITRTSPRLDVSGGALLLWSGLLGGTLLLAIAPGEWRTVREET